MLNDDCIPRITTSFTAQDENYNNPLYAAAILNILKKILPEDLLRTKEGDSDFNEDQLEYFHSFLPFVRYSLSEIAPGNLSFYVLYKSRSNAFKFFIELISRWLVPGKRLEVMMLYAVDFKFPDFSKELYTVCEVMLHIESLDEFNEIQRNLPIIETEARLGIESAYYARRILEVKGQAPDEKTALIHDYIAFLVRRLPKAFDIDVLTEMQHVLVMCRDDFKNFRESKHLSRIISIHYLFRRNLREVVKLSPEKRFLSFKLFKARLHVPEGEKTVLAILVGVNFLKDKEIFEKRHLLTAVQNYIPHVQAVEDSFFANRRGTENICTLYLEIEKTNGEDFTPEEIKSLRKELPIDLKDRIEHLMHPIFMPRNEEEIMRNVLSLSSQIKYMRDIPQVTISFDEQTHANLFFTVILVRVLKPGVLSIQEIFNNSDSELSYIHDRCKTLGYLRKKYTKEATVFRVKLPKEKYLRKDHSIDLYKARQEVFNELCRLMGEVRDFNGGMISKQNELLCALRAELGDRVKYNELLLENFFYSLTPVIMRSVMQPEPLKNLFLMQLDAIESGFFTGEGYSIKMKSDANYVYVMIKARDRAVKEEISRIFVRLQVPSSDLANSYVKVYDTPYIGYIYRCSDVQKQRQFCQTINNIIHAWDYKQLAYHH